MAHEPIDNHDGGRRRPAAGDGCSSRRRRGRVDQLVDLLEDEEGYLVLEQVEHVAHGEDVVHRAPAPATRRRRSRLAADVEDVEDEPRVEQQHLHEHLLLPPCHGAVFVVAPRFVLNAGDGLQAPPQRGRPLLAVVGEDTAERRPLRQLVRAVQRLVVVGADEHHLRGVLRVVDAVSNNLVFRLYAFGLYRFCTR
uniref:Uncharacterized protein n=1 Tax=Oryza nivara TaxID=4536 RepID=A0A0E0HQJ8_ORYNI